MENLHFFRSPCLFFSLSEKCLPFILLRFEKIFFFGCTITQKKKNSFAHGIRNFSQFYSNDTRNEFSCKRAKMFSSSKNRFKKIFAEISLFFFLSFCFILRIFCYRNTSLIRTFTLKINGWFFFVSKKRKKVLIYE